MSGACMCDAVRPSGPLGKHRTSAPLVAADQRARQRTRREARSRQSGRRSRPGQTEGKSKRRRKEPLEAHGRPGTRHAAVAVDAASRPGQGGRSPRFSYRIIPVLVRFTSFQNPHVAAPRCFHLSHLRRASDQNSNYAVRKTRRAASLAWPGGLEAASTATAACLGGRGPPTAPSCASWTSPLFLPRSA